MEASFFTQVLLPLSLAVIMFGMGLTLTLADFKRLFSTPKPVLLGLLGQLIGLPLLAIGLIYAFNVPAHIAVGIMILAACPGGTSSNLLAHIGRANLALSVSLTAITTVVCIITTPLLIQWGISLFSTSPDEQFSLIKTSVGLLVISLIPIMLGMTVRKFALQFAIKSEDFFRNLSTAFLFSMIAKIAYDEREMLMEAFPSIFIFTFTLNILATVLGVVLARFGGLKLNDAVTLGIEVGTQNGTMAILIAVTFLANSQYAVAAGVYGVTMYLGAFLLIVCKRYRLLHKLGFVH
jgi:BASS family bile acid:Na+ symporter